MFVAATEKGCGRQPNRYKYAQSDPQTSFDTSSFIMHAAALLLLHASVLVCCSTLLVKAAQFAAGCWRAHRRFSDSSIPGPKPASRLLGQNIVLQSSMHGRSDPRSSCQPHALHAPQPPCLPAGHVPQILGPKNAWVFTRWANAHGPLYKLRVLDHFLLVCTDPDTIKQLTRKGGTVWHPGASCCRACT